MKKTSNLNIVGIVCSLIPACIIRAKERKDPENIVMNEYFKEFLSPFRATEETYKYMLSNEFIKLQKDTTIYGNEPLHYHMLSIKGQQTRDYIEKLYGD